MGCFLALVVIFRSFFWENVLRPIGLIFWLIWRAIASVDQAVYWAMAIIISIFLVLRMLPKGVVPTGHIYESDSSKISNPYLTWLSVFTLAGFSPLALENLQPKLKDLTVSFLVQTGRITPKEAEASIRAKQLSISPESQSFLISDKEGGKQVNQYKLRGTYFLASFGKRKLSRIPTIVHQPINEGLSFMEGRAHIQHEHENSK